MAILYIDGFESYGNTVNSVTTANTVGHRWIAVGESSMRVQSGRVSGYSVSLAISTNKLVLVGLETTNSTMVLGVGIKVTNVGLSWPIYFRTDNLDGVNLQVNADGSVSIRRGSTTLGTSSNTGLITAGTWHHLVLKVLCDNSSGTYEVWVDGVSELSGSGADTQVHASKAYHNGVQIRSGSITGAVLYDDLYVLDGTGTVNNDTLGDKVVSWLNPSGDVTTDWTANSASTHYTEVDDVVFDGDTNFVTTNTSTDQDIYNYGSITSTANIACVQVTTDVKESAAKSYELKTLAKSTGNTVNGGDQFIGSTDWTGKSVVFEEDPDGSSWTESKLNSTEFGVEAV